MAELVKDARPLAGVVMCCTSIAPERRHLLATAAEEMGALHKFDLTSDVTHLLVGDVDTAKYKYVAKERPDVKVVMPSFINAVRAVWIEGGEVDLGKLEQENKAPALWGLRICLTGFESTSARENIKGLVEGGGGEFSGDLTKQVTHLVAAAPEGKKYEHAQKWQIKVVAYEWLQDSCQRGMVLDEVLYNPILAPQDRGKNAYNKVAMEQARSGTKRSREEEKAPEPAARRKLRRTMSKKMASQQEAVWAEITQAGSGQQRQDVPEIDSVLGILPQPGASDGSTLDTVNSVHKGKQPLPQRRVSLGFENTIFQGSVVYVQDFTRKHGFTDDRMTKFHAILEHNGARLITTIDELESELDRQSADDKTGFIIVPANVPKDKLTAFPDYTSNMEVVTEWWVELCILQKQMLPARHLLCQPFKHHTVRGFKDLTVCSTGFLDYDLLHVSNAVKMIGGKYVEFLRPDVDVVIFNSGAPINKDKLEFAAENRIPAVTEHWLIDSIDNGAKQDPKGYLVKTETPTVPTDYAPPKTKASSLKPGTARSRKGQLEFAAPEPRKPRPQHKNTVSKTSKPAPKHRRTGPFYEDDQDEPLVQSREKPPRHSRERSKEPLREMSQEEQNSQRHNSQSQTAHERNSPAPSPGMPHDENQNYDTSSAAVHLFDAAKTVGMDTSQATAPSGTQVQRKENLDNAIASLLQQKVDATSRRPSDPNPPPALDLLGRRRRGPLGRAPSGGSFDSHRAASICSNISQEDRGGRPEVAIPDPSQKIMWGHEESVEERRALLRRMGGSVEEREVRSVKSIGVVKDVRDNGAGNAGGRRSRR